MLNKYIFGTNYNPDYIQMSVFILTIIYFLLGIRYDIVDNHINIKIKKQKYVIGHLSVIIQILFLINGGFLPVFWINGIVIALALGTLFYCYWF
jgi:hypothetical protein